MKTGKFRGLTLWGICCFLSLPVISGAQETYEKFGVPDYHWAKDGVIRLWIQGIIKGYPDGAFRGNRGITREEFAVAMERLTPLIDNRYRQIEADEEKRFQQWRKQQIEIAREIKEMAKSGPDLYQELPPDHVAYNLLKEIKKKVEILPVYHPDVYLPEKLMRYDVVMILRRIKPQVFDLRSRIQSETLKELMQLTRKLESEFRSEQDAFEALLKRKGYKTESLPISGEYLLKALYGRLVRGLRM